MVGFDCPWEISLLPLSMIPKRQSFRWSGNVRPLPAREEEIPTVLYSNRFK